MDSGIAVEIFMTTIVQGTGCYVTFALFCEVILGAKYLSYQKFYD